MADGDSFDDLPLGLGHQFELGTDGPAVIVVGVDGSDTSMRAGAYATGLARRNGARLVFVYVATMTPLAGIAGILPQSVGSIEEAFEQIGRELRRQVEQTVAEFGVPHQFLSLRGDPFSELSRVADDVRADGLVVGASTSTGHRFVGSLAVKLVRVGRWPVTVVP